LSERQIAQGKIEKSTGGCRSLRGKSEIGQSLNGQNLDSAVSRDAAHNLNGNSEQSLNSQSHY
jgi:hypothetical protein